MNRRVLFSLLTLAVAAVLPCPAQSDRDGSFDHKFLSKVTQHYQGAIKIAELYQQKKATRSELKTFCSKIGIDQCSEKPQTEQWRAQGYRGEEMRVPEIPLRCNRNRRTEWPSSAAKTGDALDHRFRIAITEYRREEILDMKACVTQVEQGDLKALCPKLTGEQQKEMAQMEQRRREWFQDHGPGHSGPASGKSGLAEVLKQSSDVFRYELAFGLGQLSGDRHMRTGGQVVLEHVRLNAANRRHGGTRLLNHFEAGPLVADHLLAPTDLAFYPPQAWNLATVVGQRIHCAAGISTGHAHETFVLPVSILRFGTLPRCRPRCTHVRINQQNNTNRR